VRPLIWLVIFLLATHFVIVKGVKDGIEKSSKVLMPVLFILIVVLVGCSLSLPNAEKGLEFLLKPDFSKVNGDVFLGAMGQAFFSLSLGMGCLSTYASYFGKETKLGNTALSVGVIDTFVAVLAGLIIFPAAFSVGIQPDAGPSLIFITLPNVFQQAFSGVPILAYI
ncbi:sodium:neurotransmitter symporter family protein, partial [human gut metagenome]